MRKGLSLESVVIYAPTSLYREAWRCLLTSQPGIRVLGATGDTENLARLLQGHRPAAALIDLAVLEEESIRRIKASAPGSGLLLLVRSYDQQQIVSLLKAGANGFVSREESVATLARSVIAVARGEIVLPHAFAATTLASLARGNPPEGSLAEPVSSRESEVLNLLAQGFTNKDIAQSLVISVRTVEAHLRSIFAKLGARSRTETALWAIRHGYGPHGSPKST